ncbi:DUF1501 domain-containing protein [Anatilimnocola floriformis]|uniref:DUF1501 domain-containing protein n=1 Tax=Anatilimnocola floriformis TaxID=2948575 RepID=UPI0020C20F2C|nr:DUF1501 domain-containing protein [Anatilimnocola floriformis]
MTQSFSRRTLLQGSAVGLSAASLPILNVAARAATEPARKRSCILLWMAGGPSQLDTFDPKPKTDNGGPFQAISTNVPGLQICEHLPKLSRHADRLALIRSMQTKEGDHGRATTHLQTGYTPQGPIRFPALGSLVSKELAREQADLPAFASVTPQGNFAQPAVAAGFLGPNHAPLVVSGSGGNLKVEDLQSAEIDEIRQRARMQMLRELQQPFVASRPGPGTASHVTAYDRAERLGKTAAADAFDLTREEAKLRDEYGRGLFGQGCLLARRLVEREVPLVQVTLNGWDTHDNNFEQVKNLCGTLDNGWATLMRDLSDHGLLDSTLVVCMGEFGRTPGINPRVGRDHFPSAWSVVLGGGGVQGGSIIGRTSADGLAVEDRPVRVPDLMATIFLALGLNPEKQNMSNVGRPIRLADPDAKPIREVLA